ncbi:hypothetical protein RB596_000780 [Gaeumannomyces avenae]
MRYSTITAIAGFVSATAAESSPPLEWGKPALPGLFPSWPWCVRVHDVEPGDTCWAIAETYKITDWDLKLWNNYFMFRTCDQLEVGARLCVASYNIPDPANAPPPPPPPPRAPEPTTPPPTQAPPAPTPPPRLTTTPPDDQKTFPFTFCGRCPHDSNGLCQCQEKSRGHRGICSFYRPCDERCHYIATC